MDTREWMRVEAMGVDSGDLVVLNVLTESATNMIVDRLDGDRLPVDGSCPVGVRQAIVMRAASLYVRRESPTGIVSFGPESVFRVNRYDTDIDSLLAPYIAAMVG